MPRRSTSLLASLLAVGLGSALPALAGAQASPFPLTDANLTRYAVASDHLAAYMKQHPGEADLSAGDESYGSADEAGTKICGPHPGVRQAITSGGLTCGQWVTFTMELERTASIARMTSGGQPPPAGLGISPADRAFYQKHEAEITRVLGEIGAGDATE
jgi:hypothetical protein